MAVAWMVLAFNPTVIATAAFAVAADEAYRCDGCAPTVLALPHTQDAGDVQ